MLDMRLSAGGEDAEGNIWYLRWHTNPLEQDVLRVVERCRSGRGHVELEYIEKNGKKMPALGLGAENGRYLLILREADCELDFYIRSLSRPAADDGARRLMARGYFFGEIFPPQETCTDFELILRYFSEFFRNGNIAKQ